jgi:Coenzyme PQQ synthesis protein D (PqqD)
VSEAGRDGFLLETFSDGGFLLDLTSGDFFRLNRTATFVWERRLAGASASDIAVELARAFAVSENAAGRDVAAVLNQAPDTPIAPLTTEINYELVGDKYVFSVRGDPIFEITSSGRALRLLRALTDAELRLDLRSVCPKLLALSGASVLHASAVRKGVGPVIAVLGESGAGKTTTARAFAAAGFEKLSEDKLLLRADGADVGAVVDGEAWIEAWLLDFGSRLRAARLGAWCDLAWVAPAADHPVAAVGEILLIDCARRRGADIDLQAVGPSAAAAEILRHAFYGSSTTAEWRLSAAVSAALARTAPTFVATMPDGVASLAEAVRLYTLKKQSY